MCDDGLNPTNPTSGLMESSSIARAIMLTSLRLGNVRRRSADHLGLECKQVTNGPPIAICPYIYNKKTKYTITYVESSGVPSEPLCFATHWWQISGDR